MDSEFGKNQMVFIVPERIKIPFSPWCPATMEVSGTFADGRYWCIEGGCCILGKIPRPLCLGKRTNQQSRQTIRDNCLSNSVRSGLMMTGSGSLALS